MKAYKLIYGKIRCYEIVKTMAKQVVYKNENGYEDRDFKQTSYYSWHDTFLEAKKALVSQLMKEIEDIESKLDKLKSHFNEVLGMTEH